MATTLLDVPAEIIETALDLELRDGEVVADTVDSEPCVFLAGLHRAERAIATRLRTLAEESVPGPPSMRSKPSRGSRRESGVMLAESQREAVRLALASKVMVITGGPGVGKTTLVRSILKILTSKGVTVALAAPTGARPTVVGEHRPRGKDDPSALEADPITAAGAVKITLNCDLLVVDETSMIDVPLIRALLKAVPDHAALILVGDVDQLPPSAPARSSPTSSPPVPCRWCG